MSESYEREKLGAAVSCLASSAQPIQKRLEWAWMANHGLVKPERQQQYDEIYSALTADKSNPTAGHVPTTCAGLNDHEAERIASLIVDLDSALSHDRIYDLEDRFRAVGGNPLL